MKIFEVINNLDATYDIQSMSYCEHLLASIGVTDALKAAPHYIIQKLNAVIVGLRTALASNTPGENVMYFTTAMNNLVSLFTKLEMHSIRNPLAYIAELMTANTLQECASSLAEVNSMLSDDFLALGDELGLEGHVSGAPIACITFHNGSVQTYAPMLAVGADAFKRDKLAYLPDERAYKRVVKDKHGANTLFPIAVSVEHRLAERMADFKYPSLPIIEEFCVPVTVIKGKET